MDALNPSRKAQLEQRAVIALAAFFLFALWSALRSMGFFSSRVPSPVTAVSAPVPVPQSLETSPDRRLQQLEGNPSPVRTTPPPALAGPSTRKPNYTAQGLRDPLKSLLPEPPPPRQTAGAGQGNEAATARPPAPPPQLSVQGMWWQGDESRALINGNVYKTGDTVGGATVVAINREGVTIEFDGMTHVIGTGREPAQAGSRQQPGRRR